MTVAFEPRAVEPTVSDVAARTGLARPTARRLSITLERANLALLPVAVSD